VDYTVSHLPSIGTRTLSMLALFETSVYARETAPVRVSGHGGVRHASGGAESRARVTTWPAGARSFRGFVRLLAMKRAPVGSSTHAARL